MLSIFYNMNILEQDFTSVSFWSTSNIFSVYENTFSKTKDHPSEFVSFDNRLLSKCANTRTHKTYPSKRRKKNLFCL